MPLRARCFLPLLTALGFFVGCRQAGWQVEGEGPLTAGPLLLEDRVLVVGSRYGVTQQLRAYDARTGKELWQSPLADWDPCTALVGEPVLVVSACGTRLYAHEPVAGGLLWKLETDGPVRQMVSLQSGILTLATQLSPLRTYLEGIDATRGSPLFQLPLLPGAEILPIEGALLVYQEETLERIELETAARTWHVELEEPIQALRVTAEGVAAILEDRLVGIDPKTGAQRWQRTTRGAVDPSALGGLLVYGEAGELIGLDLVRGDEKWRVRLAGVVVAPMITHQAVYVHTAGSALHALSPVDGRSLWNQSIAASGVSPVIDDDYYAWRLERHLQRFDLARRRSLPPVLLPTPSRRSPVVWRSGGTGPGAWTAQDTSPRRTPPFLIEANRLYGVSSASILFMHRLDR